MYRVLLSVLKGAVVLLVLVCVSFIILSFVGIARGSISNAEQLQGFVDGCPEGSYNIGVSKTNKPLCKLDPTGCPYGDSIPLGPECDKQAPQPPQVIGNDTVIAPVQQLGK